jgi:MinD superfamily P-loop ATPase
MAEKPVINKEKCHVCGLCVDVCQCGGLVIKDNAIQIVKIVECDWCGMCELACPEGAISLPYEIVIEKKPA